MGGMDETQHGFTLKGALKWPIIKKVCQWVKQLWSRAREDIIILYMRKKKKKKKKKVQMTVFRYFKGQFGFIN